MKGTVHPSHVVAMVSPGLATAWSRWFIASYLHFCCLKSCSRNGADMSAWIP